MKNKDNELIEKLVVDALKNYEDRYNSTADNHKLMVDMSIIDIDNKLNPKKGSLKRLSVKGFIVQENENKEEVVTNEIPIWNQDYELDKKSDELRKNWKRVLLTKFLNQLVYAGMTFANNNYVAQKEAEQEAIKKQQAEEAKKTEVKPRAKRKPRKTKEVKENEKTEAN